MAKLVISSLARADMMEIGDYISRELRNPNAAMQQIRRLQGAMLPLQEFPEMGSPLFANENQMVSYRYLVCSKYLVFYHVDAETVLVDRVLYGRRDYLALLFRDKIEDE